jgi:hypothetical protein
MEVSYDRLSFLRGNGERKQARHQQGYGEPFHRFWIAVGRYAIFFALRKVKRKYVIICPFCVTLSKHYPLFL